MSGANPSVAKLRMSNRGLVTNARPIASICCSPPSWLPRFPRPFLEPRKQFVDPGRVHAAAECRRLAKKATRCSSTVRFGKHCRPSGTRAIPARPIRSGRQPTVLLAGKADLARLAWHEAAQRAQGCRLAHPVAPKQGNDFPLIHRQIDAKQNLAGAVGNLKCADLQQLAHRWSPRYARRTAGSERTSSGVPVQINSPLIIRKYDPQAEKPHPYHARQAISSHGEVLKR